MPTKFRDLDKLLRAQGFKFDHATGSHYIYKHPTRGSLTVPFHGDNVELKPGTLKSILKRAGLS